MTLVPEVSVIKQSLAKLQGDADLNAEVRTLANTDYSKKILIEGKEVSIQEEFPSAYASILGFQANAKAFLESNVLSAVTVAVEDYSSVFQLNSTKLLDILRAAGDNPLSAAQNQALEAAMDKLIDGLNAQDKAIHLKASQKLSDLIDTQDGQLQAGAAEIQKKVDQFKKQLRDLIGYFSTPGADHSVLTGPKVDSYNKEISVLSHLHESELNLIKVTAKMSAALITLLDIWRKMSANYKYVATQIKQASEDINSEQGPSIGHILAEGDIDSAKIGWDDIVSYAKSLN